MSPYRRGASLAGGVAMWLCASLSAFAQDTPPVQPQRPFVGLFRGAPTAPHDNLALRLSLYGAYDEDRAAGGDLGAAEPTATGGLYTGADAVLAYTPAERGRVSFNFNGMTSLRYYARLSDLVAASQSASAGTSIRLARRTSLQGRGGVSYTPYFDYVELPGMEVVTGPEVPQRVPGNTVSTRQVMSYDGAVDLTHDPSDRTSLSFRYGARLTQFLDEGQDSVDLSASAAWNRRLNRRMATRVTYVHRDSQYDAGALDQSVRVDDLELAFDRDWARSPTRRTTFSFSVGPSVVKQAGDQSTRFFGGVTVTHPFARSWSVRGLYRRGVTFVEGSGQPFLSHSGIFALSGLLTRRLDMSASVGAVLGDLGLEVSTTPYDTYSASSRIQYALNRTLALSGEYLFNYSQYSGTGAPGINRSSVRVGLTVYMPLIQERTPSGRQ